MVDRFRIGGPTGTDRPYRPTPNTHEPAEQIAQALDHIAVSLSAIDHNLEVLTKAVTAMARKQGA